jgi:hypothetical protein
MMAAGCSIMHGTVNRTVGALDLACLPVIEVSRAPWPASACAGRAG